LTTDDREDDERTLPGFDPAAGALSRSETPTIAGASAPLQLTPAEPAASFGKYELVGELGRGGMGAVYKAWRADLQAFFAVKVLHAGAEGSADAVGRFHREAQVAARLRHPGIVAVHDIGVEQGRPYFAMEYVEGTSLAEVLEDPSRASLPAPEGRQGLRFPDAARIAREIAEAVDFAHKNGVVHRDLKPSNVVLALDGRARVLDFGLAKLLDQGKPSDGPRTLPGVVVGTLAYMPPEQAEGNVEAIGPRSDVYSLGTILYQMVTGQPPYRGRGEFELLAMVLGSEPVSPRTWNPTLPPDLETITLRAMERDPARRYASAGDLAADLGRYLAGDPIHARPPTVSRRTIRWVRRHAVAAASTAVAVLGLLGVFAWQLTRPGEIEVRSDIEGAFVEVDGEPFPRVAAVPAGRHLVKVSAEGHDPEVREVDVRRGERRTAEFRLRPSMGTLSVNTNLEGCAVEVLGEAHGTPLTRHPLPIGEYVVKVRKTGHESRERRVEVRRALDTAAWVALPPSGAWHAFVADVGMDPATLRDATGDGVLDVSLYLYGHRRTWDGRTGAEVLSTGVTNSRFARCDSVGDLDGDGVADEVISHVQVRPDGTSAVLLVEGWSARPDPEEPARGVVPSQRRLWRRELPVPERNWPLAVSAVGPNVVLRRAEGLDLVEGSTGKTIVVLPYGTNAGVARLPGTEDAIVTSGRAVVRIGPSGEGRWRHETGSEAWVASAMGPVLLVAGADLVALDPADGSVRWKREGAVRGARVHLLPPDALLLATEGELACVEIADGAERFRVATPGRTGLLSCAPGLVLEDAGARLVGRSARTGEVAWTYVLNGRPACPAACAAGLGGAETYVAYDDRRIVVLDATGRAAREVLLPAPPRMIVPCRMDADGRTDLVLIGNGVQALPSTRVVWKRTLSNSVRPRPVAIQVEGRTWIVLAGVWEEGQMEMRALDAATGAVEWRFGGKLDVLFEPGLEDIDGDGVLDVVVSCQDEPHGMLALSGRTGGVVRSWPGCDLTYGRPGFADVDGDGEKELIAPTFDKGTQAWKAGGKEPLWTANSGGVLSGVGLADLDGDGAPEVLVASEVQNRTAGLMLVAGIDGTSRWGCRAPEPTRCIPAAVDLDGDGAPEVLLRGTETMIVLDAAGRERATWKGMGGSIYPPVLVDADGDGTRELLTGISTGVALLRFDGTPIWSYPASTVGGAVGVADLPSGRSAVGIDAAGRFFVLDLRTGAERWRIETRAHCEGGVTLADADGDGVPEAFFGSYDFGLYAVDLR